MRPLIMGVEQGPSASTGPVQHGDEKYSVDARQAKGVQVGEGNTQIIYIDESRPWVPPRQLPHDRADFTGRTRELAHLEQKISGKPGAVLIMAISGKPGVGKSALAVHLAWQLAGRYPDAQLYADLRGADAVAVDSGDVLGGFLLALGMPQSDLPARITDRVAAYRSRLSSMRALIVLDNTADEAQVLPLLPGAPKCLVLVTSRRDLVINGAEPLVLDAMDDSEALELFSRTAGTARAAAEAEAASKVMELCGRLPLAIQIAAARLRKRPEWPISHLVGRLSGERRRLAELRVSDLDIRASFSISYQELKDTEACLFRLLGVVPSAEFDVGLAAALANSASEDVEAQLERLADMHLIEAASPGRYGFHDLLRLFARERLEDEDSPAALSDAIRNGGHWYAEMMRAAVTAALASQRDDISHDAVGFDRSTALAWLDAEWTGAVAIAESAVSAGLLDVVNEIDDGLYRYLVSRRNVGALERLHRLTYEIADQHDDLVAMSAAANNLGYACAEQNRLDEAIGWYETAVRLAGKSKQYEYEVTALVALAVYRTLHGDAEAGIRAAARLQPLIPKVRGTAAACSAANTLAACQTTSQAEREWLERSYVLAREAGSPFLLAEAARRLGDLAERTGDREEACRQWTCAIEHARDDNIVTEAWTFHQIGQHCIRCQWFDKACHYLDSALRLHRYAADRLAEADVLENLARAHVFREGHVADARQYADQALSIRRELKDSRSEGRCQNLLAYCFCKEGRFSEAATCYREAYRILRLLDGNTAADARAGLRWIRVHGHEQGGNLLRHRKTRTKRR